MNGSFAQSAAVEARIPCRTAQGRYANLSIVKRVFLPGGRGARRPGGVMPLSRDR